MSIEESHQAIVNEFLEMDDWQERYHHIVDLGKELVPLDEKYQIPEWKVSGCVSQVWLKPKFEEGKLYFEADSDSLFVKGLIALLLQAYSGYQPEEILGTEPDFIKKIGITENLSPNRANGLGSMIKYIKEYAKKYSN